MAEFGSSLVDENAEVEGSREGVEPDIPAWTTEDGIELHGFQWRLQDGDLMNSIGEPLWYLIRTT